MVDLTKITNWTDPYGPEIDAQISVLEKKLGVERGSLERLGVEHEARVLIAGYDLNMAEDYVPPDQ